MTVAQQLELILGEIKNYNPTIIAVTKYYDEKKMIEAFNSGLRNFGESRALDAVEKIIVWGLSNGYTFLPLDATSPDCHHGINN